MTKIVRIQCSFYMRARVRVYVENTAMASSIKNDLFPRVCVCKKVKLVALVEGDPKAPFSIATTPRCRGGRYYNPWIVPLYSWSVPYNAESKARRHQTPFFGVFDLIQPGIELLDYWRTLYSLGQSNQCVYSWPK